VHPCGATLRSASHDGSVVAANVGNGRTAWRRDFGSPALFLSAYRNDLLVVGFLDGRIQLLDPTTGELVSTLRVHGAVTEGAFALDGKALVLQGNNGFYIFECVPANIHGWLDAFRARRSAS
jgi:outer membrane protein assembly factor BamB